MKTLSFPVDVGEFALGTLNVSSAVLERILGPPHKAIHKSTQFPGPVKLWAFQTESGIAVAVEFHEALEQADISAKPPLLDLALMELGLSQLPVVFRRTE